MTRVIDLRSDTFTLPDAGMRRAICEAEVGNAGYGEDPSVNRLEETVAGFFGQEAALFLPSGTMAGQIAIRVHTRPGDVVLIEEFGHDYYFETGSMEAISGVQARPLRGTRGILDPLTVERAVVHPENPHARTSLIVLENSSNFGGGTLYPRETLERIFRLARDRALPVHVDGARAWNVLAATGWPASSLVAPGGSLSVCLSKGLGAPMGSLLLGPAAFVAEARRIQYLLGGVMRQVGFMAAAGLYAFRHNRERLPEDHANCRLLAERLAGHPELEVDLEAVQTNILYLRVRGGEERAARLLERLGGEGIRALRVGDRVRLVTCLNVSREDCRLAAERIDVLARGSAP